ncbi:hypothetical protein LguiA_000157 [Lonicera macranthoides]
MAKRRRETEATSDVTTASYSTVFIDTSLDTHLAMIVSDSDTVSDLKRKVMFEHLQCFPKIGEIKIHALKVKRKGHFYHLSDSMLVNCAFEASKRNWFVSVDASSLKQQSENQHFCKSDASNPLALVCLPNNPSGESSLQKLVSTQCTNQKVSNVDDSSPKVSKDVDVEIKDITSDAADRRSDINVQEKHEVSCEGAKVKATNQKDDNSRNGISSFQCNNPVEQTLETMRAVKNKWKIKQHNNEVVHDRGSKDQVNSNQNSHPAIVGLANSLVSAGREISNDMEMQSEDVNVEDSRSRPAAKKKHKIESNECSGNPSELGSGEKQIRRKRKHVLSSLDDQTPTFMPPVQDVEKERSLDEYVGINHGEFSKEKHCELFQEVVERNNLSGTDMGETDTGNVKGNSDVPELAAGLNKGGIDVSFKEPVLSAKLSNVKVVESLNSDGRKRKKKKAKKSATTNQDLLGMEQANDAASDIALTVQDNEKERSCNDLRSEAERFLLIPKNNEFLLNHDAEQMLSERVKSLSQGNTDVKIKEPAVSAKLSEVEGAIESGEVGGIKKEKKVKKSAARNRDVSNLKHANNVLSSGISQTAPNSAINGQYSDKLKKDESILSNIEREEASQQKSIETSFVASDRVCDSVSGYETESLPLTQVNRSRENADIVDEKSDKKLKKGRLSTPKVLSYFPTVEQEHIVESLQLNEVEKNQDAVNMDNGLKKKRKKNQKSTAKRRPDLPSGELGFDGSKPEAKIDRDEHMEVSKCEGDEINFKHYFVPMQEESEFTPVDKLKEARKPYREMKAKNKEKPVASSLSTSPDLQNPDKLYESQVPRKKSSSIQPQESLSKAEDNEFMPPPKKSSEVPGSAIKTRSDTSFNGTSNPAAAYKKGYNGLLTASRPSPQSSDRSLQSRRDNKHQPGVDTYHSAVRKGSAKNTGEGQEVRKASTEAKNGSQHEKNLLDTPGAIFTDDDSSDSSADENKTVNSDISTRSPSKNSSSSGSSQDSPKNGPYDTKRKEGGKNIMKSLWNPGVTQAPLVLILFSLRAGLGLCEAHLPLLLVLDFQRGGLHPGSTRVCIWSAGPKNITMDMIFRSSSRFKKAKLSALGDGERQPVDYVPDSQANA